MRQTSLPLMESDDSIFHSAWGYGPSITHYSVQNTPFWKPDQLPHSVKRQGGAY